MTNAAPREEAGAAGNESSFAKQTNRTYAPACSAIDGILAPLLDVRQSTPTSWRASCPHGNHRSRWTLVVTVRSDGKVGVYCHAGCDYLDVLAAIDRRPSDLYPRDSWHDIGAKPRGPRLDALDTLQLILTEMLVCELVASDILSGVVPPVEDIVRLRTASARVSKLLEFARHGR